MEKTGGGAVCILIGLLVLCYGGLSLAANPSFYNGMLVIFSIVLICMGIALIIIGNREEKKKEEKKKKQ